MPNQHFLDGRITIDPETRKLDVKQLKELAEALLDLTETQELTLWLAAKLA